MIVKRCNIIGHSSRRNFSIFGRMFGKGEEEAKAAPDAKKVAQEEKKPEEVQVAAEDDFEQVERMSKRKKRGVNFNDKGVDLKE